MPSQRDDSSVTHPHRQAADDDTVHQRDLFSAPNAGRKGFCTGLQHQKVHEPCPPLVNDVAVYLNSSGPVDSRRFLVGPRIDILQFSLRLAKQWARAHLPEGRPARTTHAVQPIVTYSEEHRIYGEVVVSFVP
jgi:hypothetical protein